MTDHQEKYKKKAFTDTNNGRLVRTLKHEERRKVNRAEHFSKHRDVVLTPEIQESAPRLSDTVAKLRRWQHQRDLKRRIESQKKKPAFKVGVVHHKFYSPPVSSKTQVDEGPCHTRGGRKVKHHPTPTKRITRATQKRLDAKLAGTASTTPAASLKAKVPKSVKKRLPAITKEPSISFAPENHSFKPPAGLTEIPLFGRFAIPINAKLDKSYTIDDRHNEPIADDKPWPQASELPVEQMTRASRNRLVRQRAIERSSLSAPEPPSRLNSSLETFTLRLSSDSQEDSREETNEVDDKSKAAKQLDQPQDTILADVAKAFGDLEDVEVARSTEQPDAAEIAKIIEIANTTPPRSGTPIPASFSPYVVSSRGKGSARKEQKLKMGIGTSPNDEIPTKETVMQNLNISIEEEEKTAQYFKFILQREIDRLRELCDKWNDIMQDPELTEDAQYQINQAIGQTNLLIRKKFERFRRLVLDCETGKGEMLVQCRDLQGFWDMMYMEVKDCESRFLKLDYLRSKGWIEDQIVVVNKKSTRKKIVAAKPTKVVAKSSARSWILEARKKKMSQNDEETNGIVIAVKTMKSEPSKRLSIVETKNNNYRRSFSNLPITPNREKMRITPNKTPTLLKQVQLSEASKSVRSPLAVMKISKMCKTPEITMDETISYVNSDQTPAKGILKKSDDTSSSESCVTKSARKVDFNDDVFLDEVTTENEINEELQNSLDLGRALAMIDSYDNDDIVDNDFAPDLMQNVTVRRAEKRLDFDDDSFDENADEIADETSAVPVVNVVPASPKSSASDNEQNVESSTGNRVLRNRIVAPTTPNKKKRRSVKSSVYDKYDMGMNSSAKENSDPSNKISGEIDSGISDNVDELNATRDLAGRRRSTRKSVKFTANDCTVCTPKKPALPVTPRVRRSRKISLLGECARDSIVPSANGDLMSFDSPAKVPARTRRSTVK